jgi:hypothetical protein
VPKGVWKIIETAFANAKKDLGPLADSIERDVIAYPVQWENKPAGVVVMCFKRGQSYTSFSCC